MPSGLNVGPRPKAFRAARFAIGSKTPLGTSAAWTQTFATASTTVPAVTATSQAAAYTTTGATTDIASKADLNTLRGAYELLRADSLINRQLINGLIDELQARGFVG